jgi:hypothetical protein
MPYGFVGVRLPFLGSAKSKRRAKLRRLHLRDLPKITISVLNAHGDRISKMAIGFLKIILASQKIICEISKRYKSGRRRGDSEKRVDVSMVLLGADTTKLRFACAGGPAVGNFTALAGDPGS